MNTSPFLRSYFSMRSSKSRFSSRGTTRITKFQALQRACSRLANLEKTIDQAFFQHKSIDRSEYREWSSGLLSSWEYIAKALVSSTFNRKAPKGLQTLKKASIDPSALSNRSLAAGGVHTFSSSIDRLTAQQDILQAFQEGVDIVFAHLSQAIAKQVGPVNLVSLVPNDHPRLTLPDDPRGAICSYSPSSKEIFISSACAHSTEAIRLAVAFATCQHVYEFGPSIVQDKLNDYFLKVAAKRNELKTDAYGERSPYFKSRAFWCQYQGVVPTIETDSGFVHIDLNRAGIHMATIGFASLLAADIPSLAKILRDNDHRFTLFLSLASFSTVARKGGKFATA